MRILAIETSCDETAIAIADFLGTKKNPRINVLSSLVSSQISIHQEFGGVVPNLTVREHQKNLCHILISSLKESGLYKKSTKFPSTKKIHEVRNILTREKELLKRFEKSIFPIARPTLDAIAVTYGPGLAPALWVGVNFAKALSALWDIPIIPTNHMAGHLYSSFIKKESAAYSLLSPRFPLVSLLVSGGHTELILTKKHGDYTILGETQDDAAGEAFDKVARILGLPYPGGPQISKLATQGKDSAFSFPSPMIHSKDYNFSFSGLKTSVFYTIRDMPKKDVIKNKANIAASFERAATDVLIKKTIRAAHEYNAKNISLGGGVAANKRLRLLLSQKISEEFPRVPFLIPDMSLTGDNALMIATAAFFAEKKKDSKKIGAEANVRL